jgi:signal transduction histidine kinase
MLESSTVVATIATAADGRILGANGLMRRSLGLPDTRSGAALRRIDEFLVEGARWPDWRDAIRAGRASVEVALRGFDGVPRRYRGDAWVQGDGPSRRLICVLVEDDRDALRAAAQHSARMEALGSLTAGVAHDFNNLLTVLVGNLYLVGEDVRDQPKVFEKLKAARDAGKRGTDLIKQLLAFARREDLDVGTVDPTEVVANLLPLLRRALGSRITLETDVEECIGSVRVSAAQLESVVVNLAMNARDAIEGKGRIKIDVQGVDVGAAEAAAGGVASSGRYVAVRVHDTGSGIAADTLERVFEPFYSTKGERGGTGLGLSMVRWFAEQAGGAAMIESVVGQGTTVTVLLPRHAEQVADANDRTMPLSTLPTGNERVVVLALEETLRATIHQTLEVLGYRVKVATGTEDMLAAVAAEPTDLLMVDGLGRGDADVLIRARALQPELKIVSTIDSARASAGMPVVGVASLGKPFTLAELASVVRRTLEGAAGNAL